MMKASWPKIPTIRGRRALGKERGSDERGRKVPCLHIAASTATELPSPQDQGQTDQDGVWGRMAHSLRQRPSNPPSLRRNPWPSSNPPPGPCGLRRTSGLHLAFVEPSRFFSAFVLAFCIGLRQTPSPFVEPPGLRRTFARPPHLRRTSPRPVGIPSLRRSSPAILLFGHPDVFSPYKTTLGLKITVWGLGFRV